MKTLSYGWRLVIRMSTIRWTEQITICALHSLENVDLSNQENQLLYGDCYQKHGHDYHVQVVMECSVNEKSGIALDRSKLELILKENLIKQFNGHFLNRSFDCTSGEALSVYFFKLMKPKIEKGLVGARLMSLHIQETRKNWFSYSNL